MWNAVSRTLLKTFVQTTENSRSIAETNLYPKVYKILPNCSPWQIQCSFKNIGEIFFSVSRNFCSKSEGTLYNHKHFQNTSFEMSLWSRRSQFWKRCQNVHRRNPKVFRSKSQKLQLEVGTKKHCFPGKIYLNILCARRLFFRKHCRKNSLILQNVLTQCQAEGFLWWFLLPKRSSAQVECSYENNVDYF